MVVVAFVLGAAILFHAREARAFDWWPFGNKGIKYSVEIDGLDKKIVKKYELEKLARQAIDKDRSPKTVGQLGVYGGLMAERIRKAMESRGYYDATARASVASVGDKGKKGKVSFDVVPGRRYKVQKSEILWENDPIEVPGVEKFFLPPGSIAEAQKILDGAEEIKRETGKNRCFLSLDVTPRVVLNRAGGTAAVQYRAAHGASANFGDTHFDGDTAVSEEILKKYVKWKKGECFTYEKVEATQTALLQTQLLASAKISYPDAPNEDGEAPMTVTVTDRPHRTVTAGATYGSDEGVGVSAGWEHRNLRGKAHKFTGKAVVSQLEYGVKGTYTVPFFLRDNQKLNVTGSTTEESTDTYNSASASALATIDRRLTKEFSVGGGTGWRSSRVDEAGDRTENFGFLYFPVYAEWDDRDDNLDPTEGIYGRGATSYYSDVTGKGIGFLKTEIEAQTYFTQEKWVWKPTLALRAAYGQINGASSESVPADLRFYAGGGGSVRGYDFRSIGPKDNGEPAGGTVWTEFSAETRLRFNDAVGGVAFVDAGNVYDEEFVKPTQELFFSAGVGGRYYSPIGPIRLDVGFPLDEINDGNNLKFGVYVSIGQAF
ncbi:MAG: BamA/TamA family outer membrane protein [Rickettsiales bacterium]